MLPEALSPGFGSERGLWRTPRTKSKVASRSSTEVRSGRSCEPRLADGDIGPAGLLAERGNVRHLPDGVAGIPFGFDANRLYDVVAFGVALEVVGQVRAGE